MSNRIILFGIIVNLNKPEIKDEVKLEEVVIADNTDFWNDLELTIPEQQKSTSDTLCWNCTLYPSDKIYRIPIFSYISIRNKNQSDYKIQHNYADGYNRTEESTEKYIGYFCCPPCLVLFLIESYIIPAHCKESYLKMFYHIYSKECGKRVVYIPPAHPKHLMKQYCGEYGISEQEYREKNKILELSIITL